MPTFDDEQTGAGGSSEWDEFDKAVSEMSEEQRKRLYASLPKIAQGVLEADAVAEKQARQDQLHAAFKRECNQAIRAGRRWELAHIRDRYVAMGYVPRPFTPQDAREINNTFPEVRVPEEN